MYRCRNMVSRQYFRFVLEIVLELIADIRHEKFLVCWRICQDNSKYSLRMMLLSPSIWTTCLTQRCVQVVARGGGKGDRRDGHDDQRRVRERQRHIDRARLRQR